ncbi:MAG TPA: hypothetical protein VI935_02920 [Thermodesulfobacteriota bacterium]|nr:hypothetical protein [Thermodesulfobacteriota bacterium]
MGRIKQNQLDYNFKIHYLINGDEFLKLVKKDPYLIYYNYNDRYAIERLQETCRNGNKKDVNLAKKILIKAGLPAFIPKQSQKRTTENQYLKYWKAHPFEFVQGVEELKTKLQPLLKQHYKQIEREDKRKDIKNCYKQIFGEDLTDNEVKLLTKGECDKDLTTIALSILSYRMDIPFESLKKSFYKASQKEKLRRRNIVLIVMRNMVKD